MKCIETLLRLLLALPIALCKPVTGTGFILPRDAPQGLLRWTEHDDFANYTILPYPDNETDIDINGNSNSSAKTIGPRMIPLPISKWGCNEYNLIEVDDLMELTWMLKVHCDVRTKHQMDIPSREILALHMGNGWTYSCNWARPPKWNPCDSKEVAFAMDFLDGECGGRNTGWVYMHHWKKSYGREIDGIEICPNICPVGRCGMITKQKADGTMISSDFGRLPTTGHPRGGRRA